MHLRRVFRLCLAVALAPFLFAQTPREALQRDVGGNAIIGAVTGAPLKVATVTALKAALVTRLANGQQVEVAGYAAAGDGGGGIFQYNSASSESANNGTVVAPTVGAGRWLRVYSGAINVRWFGAKGDGSDATTSIQAAISSLTAPAAVYLPTGTYIVSATLTQTEKVKLFGDGNSPVNFEESQTLIQKAASLSGPAITISVRGTSIEGMNFEGVGGNGGDGIVIWANDVLIRDVGVFAMGRDGIRIGKDTGVIPTINANAWRLDNVSSAYNVRHGVYINDKTISTSDANSGVATGLRCSENGGDGLSQANAVSNTFVGGLYEGNDGYGLNFAPTAADSVGSMVYGGDSEQNTAGKCRLSANCINYVVMLSGNQLDPITDLSGLNIIFPAGNNNLDSLATYTYGESFIGKARYHTWAADSVERLRVGWSNKAIDGGLIAAQILADTQTLKYITRAHNLGTHAFYAGPSNALVVTIDKDRTRIIGSLRVNTTPEYADNAAALLGGLVAGDVYRTVDALKVVH